MKLTRRNAMAAMAAAGMVSASPDATGLSNASKLLLQDVARDKTSRGKIDAAKVTSLMANEKLGRDALMLKLLSVARSNAHPPISQYFVGAVASGASGSIYLGQNIEVPGATLGLAVHGEQSAIANAYMSGESDVDAIAVTGAPCGHCRQFLGEVSLQMGMRIVVPDQPIATLAELLPRAFTPRSLGSARGAFPVVESQLALMAESEDELVLTALKAARRSYSPYSKSPSGVALKTSAGYTIAGSYIENVAFNPSLPPLQTALAGYFAAGPDAGEIEKCVLVERPGAYVSHLATARLVLLSIAPKAELQIAGLKG